MSKKVLKGIYDRDNVKHEIVANIKVTDATAGNFPAMDEEGNLVDSQYSPASFADAGHSHSEIETSILNDGSVQKTAKVETDAPSEGNAKVSIKVADSGAESLKQADITSSNIARLKALLDGTIQSDVNGKMEKAVVTGDDGDIVFAVESNNLALYGGDTDYTPLFRNVGAAVIFPVKIGVYDSNEDTTKYFMGFCEANRREAITPDEWVLTSKVYIGSRVLCLEKDENGTITLESTYTLESLLA